MSTTVYYNGVTLTNVTTRRFEQTPIYDPSGTDLMYHRFIISVTGYVHTIRNPVTKVDVTPGSVVSAAEGEVTARKLLMQPRGEFKMGIGSLQATPLSHRILLECSPGYSDSAQSEFGQKAGSLDRNDVNNGPHPRACNITRVVGSAVLIIEFTIEICMVECPGQPTNTEGVLSNRWSMHDTVDANWYTTRTITGFLRVANLHCNIAEYRRFVLPAVQPGFKRVSVECTISKSGLEMEYTATDQQFYVAAPSPVRSWSMTHSAQTDSGNNYYEECHCIVEGDANTSKLRLANVMIEMIDHRLGLSFNPGRILEKAHIINYVDQCKCEAHVKMRVSQGVPAVIDPKTGKNIIKKSAFFEWIMADFTMGRSLGNGGRKSSAGYDPRVQAPMPAFGTTDSLGLFICHLQNPCQGNHGITQAQVTPGKMKQLPAKPPTIIRQSPGDINPITEDVSGNFIKKQAGYTNYDIQTSHSYVQNTVAIPIARSAASQSASSGTSFAFINMAPKMCRRHIVVTAQRHGLPPEMPSPTSFNFGPDIEARAVGDMVVTAKSPTYGYDKNQIVYETQCEYEFALSKAPSDSDPLILGVVPYDAKSQQHSQIAQRSFFDSKLIGNVRPIS